MTQRCKLSFFGMQSFKQHPEEKFLCIAVFLLCRRSYFRLQGGMRQKNFTVSRSYFSQVSNTETRHTALSKLFAFEACSVILQGN